MSMEKGSNGGGRTVIWDTMGQRTPDPAVPIS